jgi:hypothetical protein
MKRVLQQSYTDIFAASVEQRQKWAQEIIGLHATVKGGTSFSILIATVNLSASSLKMHDTSKFRT